MTKTIPSAAERIVHRLSKEFDEAPETIARLVLALEEGTPCPMLAWHPKETRAVTAAGRMPAARVYGIARRLEEIKILEEHRSVALTRLEGAGRLDEATQERALRAASLDALDLLLGEQGLSTGPMPEYKRRAQAAREAGLEPLATMLRDRQLPEGQAPFDVAAPYVAPEHGRPDAKAALDQAKALIIEHVVEDQELLRTLYDQPLVCRAVAGRKIDKSLLPLTRLEKRARAIGAREFLAIKRGVREGQLEFRLALAEEKAHQILAAHFVADLHDPSDPLRAYWDSLLREAWIDVLRPRVEHELWERLREKSEQTALQVFVERYEQLLAQPGLGPRRVLGVLPSLRKPARIAAVDERGHVLHRDSLDLSDEAAQAKSREELRALVQRLEIEVVALGNGLGFRDAEGWLMETFAGLSPRPQLVVVDETGTAEVAKKKRSKQELAVRRAAILARRAQHPLTEWARVEPVDAPLGEGATEVHQGHLARRLHDVREMALHETGVDLHYVHEDVLAQIHGIDAAAAHELQKLRNGKEPPKSLMGFVEQNAIKPERMDLAAPFLRYSISEERLDGLRIPTSLYGLVDECATLLGLTREQMLAQPDSLARIEASTLANDERSEHTIREVLAELRNPRVTTQPLLRDVAWRADVTGLEQVTIGMELQGRVLRLLEFGAFVDIGLPVGGLLHVSQLANHFVEDPAQVVREGDVVTVRVLDVDKTKGRISLTMREGDIEKIPQTLGDLASGKRKPAARVVDRSERVERGPSSRFDQRAGRGGDDDRGRRGAGGRGGPGRGQPGGRRDGGERGERGDRGDRRGRRGDDRDVPFRRGQGGYVVESEDLREEIEKDRGAKGELKSFAALAGLFGKAEEPRGEAREERREEAPERAAEPQPVPPVEPASAAEPQEQAAPSEQTGQAEQAPNDAAPNEEAPREDAPAQHGDAPSEQGSGDEEPKRFGEDFV